MLWNQQFGGTVIKHALEIIKWSVFIVHKSFHIHSNILTSQLFKYKLPNHIRQGLIKQDFSEQDFITALFYDKLNWLTGKSNKFSM